MAVGLNTMVQFTSKHLSKQVKIPDSYNSGINTLESTIVFVDICGAMKQIQVKWNKVSPADLSSAASAQFFAFSKNNDVFVVDKVGNDCLFTKIIQTSANFNRSIYEMDIWVGRVTENVENVNYDSELLMDILAWSAKVQMEAEEDRLIKLKAAADNKITKRTRLRMLASIAQ